MFLNHFIKFRSLYIKVNVLKEREFSIVAYHVKKNLEFLNESSVFMSMKLILFLSKLLMLAEIRY